MAEDKKKKQQKQEQRSQPPPPPNPGRQVRSRKANKGGHGEQRRDGKGKS
jgi:hypothetical protein